MPKLAFTIVMALPKRTLSQNARPHYMQLARAKSEARSQSRFLSMIELNTLGVEAGQVLEENPITIQPRYYFPTKSKRDIENLRNQLKAHQDGIADALRIDDEEVTILRPIVQVDKAHQRMELIVRFSVKRAISKRGRPRLGK